MKQNRLCAMTGLLSVVMIIAYACVPPPPSTPTGCAAKKWIETSPYFGNPEIFEAKGVANPSPNFQKQRMDAIENGIEVLSMLLETKVDGYSESYVHEFRNYLSEGTNSSDLYDRLRTTSYENVIKRIKMDECPDNETARYWVLVYITEASIQEATLDAMTDLEDFIAQQNRDDFKKTRDEYREVASKRNQELQQIIAQKLGSTTVQP